MAESSVHALHLHTSLFCSNGMLEWRWMQACDASMQCKHAMQACNAGGLVRFQKCDEKGRESSPLFEPITSSEDEAEDQQIVEDSGPEGAGVFTRPACTNG
jgi:hypothetical protein